MTSTDQIKLTGGIRYTEDRMRSTFQVVDIRPWVSRVAWAISSPAPTRSPSARRGSPTNPRLPLGNQYSSCVQGPQAAGAARVPEVKTSAPTWLLGVDYKPMGQCAALCEMVAWLSSGAVSPRSAPISCRPMLPKRSIPMKAA